jgi:hypothetical protein
VQNTDPRSEAAQQELLRRILASPPFAHAERLQRILRFLFDRTRHEGDPPLKEYDIAVGALGRPESFDPKTDAFIRVSIATVREKLRAYFATEGQHERLCLTVPKGQYRVRFVDLGASAAEGETPAPPGLAVRKFWQPYLGDAASNILLYTELLFFRDGRGNYFRNMYENDPAADPEKLKRHLPDAAPGGIRPMLHFVTGGEMHGALSLMRAFHEMGSSLLVKNARFVFWADIRRANLIALGSSRTNPFVSTLEGEECLITGPESIENLEPRPGEEPSYPGQRRMSGNLERMTEFTLVTRRPGPVGNSAITLIAANHGRALEGAVQFLTREDKLSGLLRILGAGTGNLPEHFQVLLRVEMIDFGEELIEIEYVTHRVVKPQAG